MIKKLLVVALGAMVSAPAWAGVGTTATFSATSDGPTWTPSLDYRAGGWLVQVHLLDLIGGLPNKVVNTGVDVTNVVVKRKVAQDVEGVLMPGIGARLFADSGFETVGFNIVAKARIGAEIKQGMGFGVYVVPTIGASNLVTGDVGLAYGGGVEISAWFVKK